MSLDVPNVPLLLHTFILHLLAQLALCSGLAFLPSIVQRQLAD